MRSGLLLIDKPKGMTSHDVVSSVRRILVQKQVGHAGTLDPLATGLMVVLMGEATKLSDYILTGNKSYYVEALLGVRSTTGDTDGEVIEQKEVTTSLESVVRAVEQLKGDFIWQVPIYSATKVGGRKLYEKARAGEVFTPPAKPMSFYNTQFLSFSENRVGARIECSKGSFIRTWVEKLGETLGCGATVSVLRRESSTPYLLQNSLPLDQLQVSHLEDGPHWVPIHQTLLDWPMVLVEGMDEKLLKNGQIPYKMARFLEIEYRDDRWQGVKVLTRKNRDLLAILGRNPSGYFIQRIFNQIK